MLARFQPPGTLSLGESIGGRMKYLACLLLMLSAASANATVTGNDLLSQLTSDDILERAKGRSYILGALDAEDWYLTNEIYLGLPEGMERFKKGEKRLPFATAHFCLQEHMTVGQVNDIIAKSLIAHPETRHQKAHGLIRSALIEQFACALNPPSK